MENSELKDLIQQAKWGHSQQGCYSLDLSYELIKVYFDNDDNDNNDDYKMLVSAK